MKERSLTEGSIPRALLRLAIPIVMANLLQSMYQMTDTFWVGRIGPTAVAAVSLSFPLLFLVVSLGLGFAIAGAVLVAQYTGEKAPDKVNLISGQTFLLMTVFSIILSVVGYVATPAIISMMADEQELRDLASSYLQLSFLGLFFTYAYVMFQSLFRGVGNVKDPLIIVATSVALNFILDPVLINGWRFVPAYGVNGAAYATIATQALSAIIGIYFMTNGRSGIRLKLRDLVPLPSEIRRIVKLGLPACAEQSTRGLSMVVLMFLVSSFGVSGTAAYGVVARILSFVIIPAMGFSMATSTVVGQNIGASQWERARKSAYAACFIIFGALTVAGIIVFFTSNQIMHIFVPTSPEVQKEGALFMQVIALTFGLIGVQQVASGALRGGGSTFLAMLLAMTTLWVLRFPLAYILSKHTGLEVRGVWWAFCVSNIISALLAWIVLVRSNWARKVTGDLVPVAQKVMDESMCDEEFPTE